MKIGDERVEERDKNWKMKGRQEMELKSIPGSRHQLWYNDGVVVTFVLFIERDKKRNDNTRQ